MADPDFVAGKLSEEFTRQGRRIAEQLRDAANQVERESANLHVDRESGLPDHNLSVAKILQTLNSFSGNLSTATCSPRQPTRTGTPETPKDRDDH